MENEKFEIRFWWLIFDEIQGPDDIPEDTFRLSSEHFLRLLEERVFGQQVQVQYEVHDCHVVATVRGSNDGDQSEFMQRLFGALTIWVIKDA